MWSWARLGLFSPSISDHWERELGRVWFHAEVAGERTAVYISLVEVPAHIICIEHTDQYPRIVFPSAINEQATTHRVLNLSSSSSLRYELAATVAGE